MKKTRYTLPVLLIIMIASSCTSQTSQSEEVSETPESEEAMIARAKEIHDRVITLDTHNDINTSNFTAEKNYTQELSTQVNIPKMKKGGLDVSWMIVYTGQGDLDKKGYQAAYENAIDKFEAIHRLCEEIAPDQIELALTSEDVRRINASGKKVAMIGIENGYPVGTDISNVKKFADLGGRYMSLAHNGHSQLSDSNTGEQDSVWLHNGLSELGKEVIAEMNKWGIMVDVSHPSKEAFNQMIELTKAPIIASHSSARALCNHSRNLDDDQLMKIKENGGVVQTVAFGSYLSTEKSKANSERSQVLYKKIAQEMGVEMLDRSQMRDMSEEQRTAYYETYMKIREAAKDRMDEVNADAPPVDVSDFVDHIDYMVKLIGLDHVGISSDFDGGGGVFGWNDASETFNVTLELVKRGYSEEQIGKLWSGNLLRVLDDVQKVANELQTSL